jgi:ribosome-associated protein YbcJ (S4-like RNA binding protein)
MYMYVSKCMYICMYVILKRGGIVGGGGTIKYFFLNWSFIVFNKLIAFT